MYYMYGPQRALGFVGGVLIIIIIANWKLGKRVLESKPGGLLKQPIKTIVY